MGKGLTENIQDDEAGGRVRYLEKTNKFVLGKSPTLRTLRDDRRSDGDGGEARSKSALVPKQAKYTENKTSRLRKDLSREKRNANPYKQRLDANSI